jgi:hypothetical protein
MRDNHAVADDQGQQPARPRRGRPRKWPSEAARREHEAAKRRLRNKSRLTPEAFDDVVRLTALADDLQRRLDDSQREVEQLRGRTRELERRLTDASRRDPPIRQPLAETPGPTPPPKMNRQQRRESERAQRRADVQDRRPAPPL